MNLLQNTLELEGTTRQKKEKKGFCVLYFVHISI